MILNPKTKKQETLIRKFAERMKLDFKQISLEEYLQQIAESRKQIRNGKKISLKELECGI